MPLKKCINDLYGIRYIFKEDIELSKIIEHVKEKYPKLRYIDSSKNGYRAVHLYFYKDNFDFPWELQIWNTKDINNNRHLHEKYKQGYTVWEKESIKEN